MIDLNFSLGITILYLLILYVFMSRFFFKPVSQVLKKRRELTEGRLESAQKRISEVERKTAEYEQAINLAKAEAYRGQENRREAAISEKAELVGKAKHEAEQAIREARARFAEQAEAARKALGNEVDTLAKELTAAMLRENS